MGGGPVLRSAVKSKAKATAVAMDCWDSSGGWEEDDEEEPRDSARPPSRVILGKAPTLDEVKEATVDLSDVVDKLPFSLAKIPATHFNENTYNMNDAQSETSETLEARLLGSSGSNMMHPSTKNQIIRAFSLLKEPQVHSVVASLASDNNFRNAVMTNVCFQDFLNSHQLSNATEPPKSQTTDSTIADESPEYTATQPEATSSTFGGFMGTMKSRVSNIANNLTDVVQGFWETPARSGKPANAGMETQTEFEQGHFLSAAMTVAFAALMMFLFKRV